MIKVKEESKNLNDELAQFTGTEHYYRHWMGKNYTDGVKGMAEKYKAYWLIDVVFSHQNSKINKIPFQL